MGSFHNCCIKLRCMLNAWSENFMQHVTFLTWCKNSYKNPIWLNARCKVLKNSTPLRFCFSSCRDWNLRLINLLQVKWWLLPKLVMWRLRKDSAFNSLLALIHASGVWWAIKLSFLTNKSIRLQFILVCFNNVPYTNLLSWINVFY